MTFRLTSLSSVAAVALSVTIAACFCCAFARFFVIAAAIGCWDLRRFGAHLLLYLLSLPVLVLCHSWPPQHLKTVALAFAVASAFAARTTRYRVKLSHYYCNYFNIYGSRRLRPFASLVLLSICGCFSLPLLRTISNSPSRVLSFIFATVAFMPYLVRLLLLLALAIMPYLARLLLLQHFAEFSRDALHLELLLGRLATTTTSCHQLIFLKAHLTYFLNGSFTKF